MPIGQGKVSMELKVKGLAGLGQVVRHRRTKQTPQVEREYRHFETSEAIGEAMESAIEDAGVTDETLIEAYERIVAGGLLRQGDGEQPWTFGNQTGVGRELALRLELAGLIKTGRKGSAVARLFFTDTGNVKRVKDNGIDSVVAMLRKRTGTE